MITTKEIDAVNLSPTKRDFYQIWNELIDTASKLSNRWDPSSTNEGDPGIVLLKVLTAIADKLNYTIDKNILEAYMPSATQEESMRKLCDMLGYTMKYYRSATVPVRISYIGSDVDLAADGVIITIPQFTNLKNEDEDVNYVTTKQVTLSGDITTDVVTAIEGECVEYDDITRDQLDDNHRYYLPEAQIAENGIFLCAKDNSTDVYTQVDNLNTQPLETKCWKFGFDSKQDTPYIEFPEDIDNIIGSGISFKFIRTNGENGNISVETLSKIDSSNIAMSDGTECEDDWFSVKNTSASTNGANKETLDAAYNNYKKTIGTFDTLITCRDYMNKIYNLTEGDIYDNSSTTPLVSNIIVSDLRDDINRAVTICSFDSNGTNYTNTSNKIAEAYDRTIDHFDLLLYPFKPYSGTGTKTDFKNSFKYSNAKLLEIKSGVDKNKAMSHDIVTPEASEIACIKDYIKIRAKISTTTKVNSVEEANILNNIYKALYNKFNLRNVDFGDRISDDMISEVIEGADSRIKNVWITTEDEIKIAKVNGEEEGLSTIKDGIETSTDTFVNLALLNVLAGRVPLFNYNESFKPEFNETQNSNYPQIYYPESNTSVDEVIGKITAEYTPNLPTAEQPIVVGKNEVVQFRTPNYKTVTTYPAYVNYFLKLTNNNSSEQDLSNTCASFKTLKEWFTTPVTDVTKENMARLFENVTLNGDDYITIFLNLYQNEISVKQLSVLKDDTVESLANNYAFIFKRDTNETTNETNYIRVSDGEIDTSINYFAIPLNGNTAVTFNKIYSYVQKIITDASINEYKNESISTDFYIYKSASYDQTSTPGYLVDANHLKYTQLNTPIISTSSTLAVGYQGWDSMYVQNTHLKSQNNWGLGKDVEYTGIAANQEYKLKDDEYLLINYTNTKSDDSGTETSTVVNEIKSAKTIIRPNFKLIDSNTAHNSQGVSYAKKTGFDFSGKGQNITNPSGMFSLAANEQIEIVDEVSINLGPGSTSTIQTSIVNVYWVLNNENSDGTFILDEDKDKTGKYTAHTLRENEYFFYTDKNKNSLAYYGNGTKIKIEGNLVLKKNTSDEEQISVDSILTYGLLANIPWVTLSLTVNNTIKLTEYKYINVTCGGEIDEITQLSGQSLPKLSHNWTKIKSFSGKLEDASELNGEEKKDDNTWEVRSLLQLNMGPALTQTLSENDKITAYVGGAYNKTTGVPEINNSENNSDLSWGNILQEFTNTSLKSNVLLQSSLHDTFININNKCQLKAFDKKTDIDTAPSVNNIPINFGNVNDNLTKVTTEANDTFTLYSAIPDGHAGIIMIYADNGLVTVEAKTKDGTSANIAKYPNINEMIATCSIANTPTILYLQKDVASINIYTTEATAKKVNIFISNMDIIPTDEVESINPQLGLKGITMSELMAKISQLDEGNQFYWNYLTDSSILINFNDKDSTETLASPDIWFDYNNICNKWTISELDAGEDSENDFNDGIVIDKASKR